jgi:type II secretory pathway predicted ATPase ExeA
MPTTDLLKTFGLSRNPFTDRTAEKTNHDSTSLYIHSDLRGFKPNDTTYVFFGKRGSGKTTIRLQASSWCLQGLIVLSRWLDHHQAAGVSVCKDSVCKESCHS